MFVTVHLRDNDFAIKMKENNNMTEYSNINIIIFENEKKKQANMAYLRNSNSTNRRKKPSEYYRKAHVFNYT